MLSKVQEQHQNNPYQLCAQPDWVTQRPRPEPDADELTSPHRYLLLDYQTMVDEAGNHSYQRMCYQVNDASCIEDMSQFLYSVRPESQSISFHRCVIYREDQPIDCLDADNIRCMQRELQLERHVSSNVLTIEFIIDDLRTGDIVDIETTRHDLKAEHPLNGHFIREGRSLEYSRPVARQIIRVMNNADANLIVQHLDSANDTNELTTIAPSTEYEKEWTDLPRTSDTGNLPAEYWPPYLCTSTETNWSDVSAHLYQCYQQAGIFDPVDLADLELNNVTEETLISNIRFIQDNIRYRSESSGIFSHTPKRPSQTLKKRTGDCKDKSTLLLSVLNAMGIDADLALVDTGLRDAINTVTPSPFLFDHMIVHFIWQGTSYFVDATIQKQGGLLATMAQLPYKSALLLKPHGGALTEVPYSTDCVVYKLMQRFDLSRTDHAKPVVTYRREYFGARADNIRQYFSADELGSIQQSYHENLADQLEAKLTPLKSMHIVNDDLPNNHLTTEESYLIETSLLNINDGYLILGIPFYQNFEISSTAKTPEQLFVDGELQQEIYIKHPNKPASQKDKFDCDNQWFHYRETIEAIDNIVHSKITVTPKSDRVDANQREEYLQQVGILRNRSTTTFTSIVTDTLQLGIELLTIASAIFAAILAVADVIPGPAIAYLIGIYSLYKLYITIADPYHLKPG